MSESNGNEKIKGKRTKDELFELIVVIMLGITAVATAWSSWQESLHGSQQDQKYTTSNALNAEANSMYNEGMQKYNQDLMIWNQLSGLYIDYAFAEDKRDTEEMEKIDYKISQIMDDNVYEEFAAAIDWADSQEGYASPFENEDFIGSYFAEYEETMAESEAMMEEGNEHNTHGDNQGLVTVVYAVVLFLLGITATFKGSGPRKILLVVSGAAFVFATVFMLTIPIVMP